MDSLGLHIEYLLQRHSCVIIPDFGAFVVTEHSARFDASTGICYPPTTEISWNSRVRNDDGLLANSFARRMNKSFEEGRNAMIAEIDELKETLQAEGEIAIGNLGVLCCQESGNLLFMPRITAEQRAEQLGLSVIDIHCSDNNKVLNDRDTNHVNLNDTEGSEKQKKKHNNSDKRLVGNDPYLHLRIKKKTINIAASICALLMLAIGVYLYNPQILYSAANDPYSQKEITPAAVVPLPKSASSITTNNHAEVDKKEVKPTATSVPKEVNEEKSKTSNDLAGKYNLIVAVFHHRDEAATYLSQNINSPYKLHLLPDKKIFRISAATADDRNQLIDIKRDKTFASKYPDAWIYQEK